LAAAYQWAWRIIGLSLGMVIPGVAGYWIDQWLGTRALFTLLGFGAGMALGMWRLLRIAKSGDSGTESSG
jgi:hypothetical protein